MSATATLASASRRRARETGRHQDALNPARGVMIGLGLSAFIWAGIGALLLR